MIGIFNILPDDLFQVLNYHYGKANQRYVDRPSSILE